MKRTILVLTLIMMIQPLLASNVQEPDLDQYPSTVISNKYISMKVYLPVPEKGIYQGTRLRLVWRNRKCSIQRS